ncbi:MAG: hypothetical protein K6D97_08060 [Clostridia bacterium]|nr:hypothetical protein [Clostridia bacterium]
MRIPMWAIIFLVVYAIAWIAACTYAAKKGRHEFECTFVAFGLAALVIGVVGGLILGGHVTGIVEFFSAKKK